MTENLCNLAAWLLCGAVGSLLLSDFIRTELRLRREQERKEEHADAPEN